MLPPHPPLLPTAVRSDDAKLEGLAPVDIDDSDDHPETAAAEAAEAAEAAAAADGRGGGAYTVAAALPNVDPSCLLD